MTDKKRKTHNASKKAYERLNLLSIKHGFDYDVSLIRDRCKLKPDSESVPKKYNNEFKKMVEALAVKHKLSALPYQILEDYILGKDFNFKEQPNFYLSEDKQSIVYKIYTDTTTKDILNDWSKISKLQKKIDGKRIKKDYPNKNLDRDLHILTLKENGKTCREITRIINEKYPNKNISYQDVSKIIQRLTS